MAKHGKKFRAVAEKVDRDNLYSPLQAAKLLLKAAGVQKGSGQPHKNKVGKVTMDKVREIAETKMADLNANDLDQAEKIIAGTARSMGITVV